MTNLQAAMYRQQLTQKYKDVLTNPYADHKRVQQVKTAIEEKVAELVIKQSEANRTEIERLKREML